MAPSIACVVFDFDGVLVASNAVKRRAYFDVFARVPGAAPLVAAALAHLPGGDRYEVIGAVLDALAAEGVLEPGPSAAAVDRYADAYNQICEEFTATCPERQGVSPLLGDLARVYGLYINSATAEAPLRRVILRRGWDVHFRDVLGRPATKRENLARIAAREAVPVRDVLFVGDRRADLLAAQACGCPFIGVQSDESDFEPGDDVTVVGEPSDLAEIVTGEAAYGRRPC